MIDDTGTGDGIPAVGAPSNALGPRRVRGRIILAVVVVLLLASGGWIVSIVNYRPMLGFSAGSVYYQGPERGEIKPPTGDSGVVFRYHAGAPFSIGFTFTNSGSRSVRILGFPRGNTGPYHVQIGVWTGNGTDSRERHGAYPTTFVPFQAFSLDPGESRYIELRYRFAQCDIPPVENTDPAQFGSGVAWDTQAVRYRVSGWTRQMAFDLPAAVGLEGAIGDCPWPPT